MFTKIRNYYNDLSLTRRIIDTMLFIIVLQIIWSLLFHVSFNPVSDILCPLGFILLIVGAVKLRLKLWQVWLLDLLVPFSLLTGYSLAIGSLHSWIKVMLYFLFSAAVSPLLLAFTEISRDFLNTEKSEKNT